MFRSLILAGGGLKVGFQAGVLQVLLDEAGLKFDHADGASGGCLNLAMYCEGRTGHAIADAWRNAEPLDGLGMNLGELLRARSLFSLDRFRKNVLRTAWRLDWNRIRSSQRLGTFNLCNFDRQELRVVENHRMDEDHLISAISLPMWFPPVEIGGENYIDSVYLTDGNLEEAIRRGADEIWAIWTVSRRGRWGHGFVNHYFQIIEVAANWRFFQTWERIEENNRMFADGKEGEFGRPIALKLIEAEVAVHYLLSFSQDRMAEAVNRGVTTAREWCEANDIHLASRRPVVPPTPAAERSGISFREEMKGHATAGVSVPAAGETDHLREEVSVDLTITVEDIDVFVNHPAHVASATGWVDIPSLGGKREIRQGWFEFLVHESDPADKRMRYRLWFNGDRDDPFSLLGEKILHDDDGFDLWSDTTTLFVRIVHGHVEAARDSSATWGAGVLHIHSADVLRQLATMQLHGPDRQHRVAAMGRFARLFLGKLWDTYARHIVPYGPV